MGDGWKASENDQPWVTDNDLSYVKCLNPICVFGLVITFSN